MTFDLRNLLTDVFEPQKGEIVLVACDVPHGGIADTPLWKDRRNLAAEWREAFEELGRERGFETRPLLTYAATGSNGADLPAQGCQSGSRSRSIGH